jgi:hypothetical protein
VLHASTVPARSTGSVFAKRAAGKTKRDLASELIPHLGSQPGHLGAT